MAWASGAPSTRSLVWALGAHSTAESNVPDKLREEYYLRKLREAFPEIPDVPAIRSESPDFILENNSHKIGIEITVFHPPPPQGQPSNQEIVSLRRRVIDMAERFHADGGGPALYLHAIFSKNLRFNKSRVCSIAQELAQVVLQSPVPHSFIEGPYLIESTQLPREIAKVWLHASISGTDKLWQSSIVGWVVSIIPEQISLVIQNKTRLIDLYRKSCDKVWLVIVHDLFSGASQCELTDACAATSYDNIFDKVLWLEPHIPRVLELSNGT